MTSCFRLERLEEEIIEQSARLVVVDSMASLVRKEFDCSTAANMVERTNLLVRQAARLKYIAETFNIPVRPVLDDQVTSICAWI